MNVLVFTTLYPNNVWPNQGVFVKERVRAVARLHGYRVKVVAPVPFFPRLRIGPWWLFSQVASNEMRDGIEVHHPRYLMTPKVGMTSYGVLMALGAWRAVQRIRRDFDIDVIDAHFVYPDGFAALLLGRALGKPVVVSARGSDVNVYGGMRLVRGLVRRTMSGAGGLIAVSAALKTAMARLGIPQDRISVISNGIDRDRFSPSSRESARRELGLPDGRMILSVGRLSVNKGFDLLVEALRVVADDPRGGPAYLVIVGDGESSQQVEARIQQLGLSGRVRLTGAVPHTALPLWYSAADVFCLASKLEGCPNVVLEAMACGTPVVATPAGGVPEVVSSERVGLIAGRSGVEIGEAILKALEMRWDREAIRAHVAARTWDHVARDVAGVFEAVHARGAGRRPLVSPVTHHEPNGALPPGSSRAQRGARR